MNQGVKVNLADQPWAECQCGGRIFEPALMFKRISPIISPTQQEEHAPLEIFICRSCGEIPEFVKKKLPTIDDKE